MKSILKNTTLNIFLVLIIVASMATGSNASLTDAVGGDTTDLIMGDLETISVKNLTRISVTNPDVADIANAESDKVTILGKSAGQTIIFLWDDMGKRSMVVRVAGQDMSITKSRIQKLLTTTQIKGVTLEESPGEGRVVVSGTVSSEDKAQLDGILEAHIDQIINLTKEEINEDLIQIDIQIAEISTLYSKNLGVSWTNSGTTDINGGGLRLGYEETMPQTRGNIKDLFKIGEFNRKTGLVAVVNAVIEQGHGRYLSKPRLVVVSGKEASFSVGGEIPIKTATVNTTGGTITEGTSFKSYGINVTVNPTIRSGKIDIVLSVGINDIDGSVSGKDTAFVTRTAQTSLFLQNNQTIALAGIIKHNDSNKLRETPFLGRVPILGLLFRSRSNPVPTTDTEMVIILTPTILKDKKVAITQTVMPTQGLRAVSKELNEEKFEQETIKLEEPVVPEPKALPIAPAPKVTDMLPAYVAPVSYVAPQAYATQIQEKIAKAISYPYEAIQNNWQGTVKLKLHILKDGTLATARVMDSSGYPVFDQDALNTAKIVAPYPAFNAGMNQEDLIVTVPVVYSQGALSRLGVQTSANSN